MAWVKGFDTLLEGFALNKTSAHLVLVATQFEERLEEYNEIIRNKNVDCTLITDFSRELPKALCQYEGCKIVVCPSRREPFSNIPLEERDFYKNFGKLLASFWDYSYLFLSRLLSCIMKVLTMATKLYSFFLVFLISFIAVLNFFAYKFHWYWEYWWFDMVMHTLGGIWVSSAALWWRYFKNPPTEKILLSKRYLFLFSLAAVSIIGICWELFEFSLDKFITFNINDPWDTASDLFFDGVGSVLAVFLFRAVYNKVSTIKITEINN